MSDFDAVLERLLGEPAFAAALAADPDAALSGYQLDAGEVELLRSQVSADSGGGLAAVETRTNKSSTMGLFSAFADLGHSLSGGSTAGAAAGHVGDAVGAHGAGQGIGDAPGGGGAGGGSAHQPWQPTERSGFGDATRSGFGGATDSGLGGATHSGFGGATRSGFGGATDSGFGGATDSGLAGATHSGFGGATDSGLAGTASDGGFGDQPVLGRILDTAEHLAPPKGYHPHIDANGDGHWDKATFIGTKGDGVEILVDVDHDGHVDFIGHDTDGDKLVDYADYDKDDNGTFEKRMYDDNGDGWLDRTVWHKDR
ncbi:hypothetical protein ODJ79_15825 [Actinoplanes sp. KI2]|uniref:hypothetical protein n=1 Tax=Actinoplanes sp. KI2 TaxID=2983315 RepID=UPI0021D56D0A|nr:hypothetical protein [Actinoplanes sp. KI2]MCU7725197.1 hypothetical protein [Actinoplanes sp. KI2]